MPAYAKSALLLLLVRMVSIPVVGQQDQARPNASYRDSGFRQSTLDPHALTLDEGLAVLGAALDSRHHGGFTSDCSHFVHGLYQRAGFPYTYASSGELYSGIDQFRRVTTPQSGDLVVWPGHVGIVVNPVQRSFFSLLRSGATVDTYDSPYWKRRGHPHFFRYVKVNPGVVNSGIAVATSLRTASLSPMAGDADSREQTAGDPAPMRAEDFSSPPDHRPARFADAQAEGATLPRTVVVKSAHPTPEHLRTAFLQSCADSEGSLRGHDIFRSAQPAVVFDHFIVRKLHLSGTQGWAEVEIGELVSVAAGKSQALNRTERQRWPLVRRARTTWELTPPPSAIYIPQNIAAHLTAQQLAQLTQDGENNRSQKTELAQLLNVLLQK